MALSFSHLTSSYRPFPSSSQSLSLAKGMGMASLSLPLLPHLRLRLRLRLRVSACADPTPPPAKTQTQTQTQTDPTLPLSTTQAKASLSSPPQPNSSTHIANPNLPPTTNGNGGAGNTGNTGNGNGKGHGDDHHPGDDGMSKDGDHDEFGPLLSFQEVMQEAEARGLKLPADMLHAAQNGGIQRLLLLRYFEMQASAWPLGDAVQSIPLLRNRMLADPSFLFKVGTEIIIDSCCATVAEVQKRGKDFWSEFELYAADLLVGVVVNVALVGMLAPYARFGCASALQQPGLLARLQQAYDALPSSVFEAERPGCRFTVQQRIGTYFYKGVLYGVVGFACGLVGQGIANLIMTAKRSVKKSDEDVPVPPLFKSAALWGAFLAVSSNTRYQIINGLERLVEASPVAKQVPPVAMAFTVGVRFANNIYGGMQFVDWARFTGCQ